MREKFFSNPGERIRKEAVNFFTVVFVLCIAACVVGIIVAIANIGWDDAWVGVYVALGALSLMGITHLVCLFIYAFGEMVENTTGMKEDIASVEDDTGYIRKRLCDAYMPEPEEGEADTVTCKNCGRRYNKTKTETCPLCEK